MRFLTFVGALLLTTNAVAQIAAAAPTPGAKPAAVDAAYDDSVARARALLKDNKFKEALEVSLAAIQIQLDDKRWEAYVTAASAYSSQGLFDDAVGMLQSALTRAPEERKPLIRDALAETRRAQSVLPLQGAGNGTAPSSPTQAEIVLWKSIENSRNRADFSGYLAAYANGIYAPLARARLEALAESSRTPEQKLAEVIGRIQGLSSGARLGNATQEVFAAGCLLSVVTTDGKGSNSSTIDLRQTRTRDIEVGNDPKVGWWVKGLRDRDRHDVMLVVRGSDPAGASQLFALLPEAIDLCKAAGGPSDSPPQK